MSESLEPSKSTDEPVQPSYRVALADLAAGWTQRQLWWRLGLIEMRRRYRRTVIGPFWTGLSMAIFAVAVGIVFSNLWKMDMRDYLPFLTSGLVAWILVSTILTESCTVFVSAEGLLKQTPLPFSIFVYLNVWRNLIVFAHNLTVFIAVIIIYPVPINPYTLMVIPGILVFAINAVWMSMLIGMIACRFRDVQPVVSSVLQISMLITPIFWPPEQVGDLRPFIVGPNVLYHFMNIIRAPLLGQPTEMLNWIVVGTITVVGWTAALILFGRYRERIIYWL